MFMGSWSILVFLHAFLTGVGEFFKDLKFWGSFMLYTNCTRNHAITYTNMQFSQIGCKSIFLITYLSILLLHKSPWLCRCKSARKPSHRVWDHSDDLPLYITNTTMHKTTSTKGPVTLFWNEANYPLGPTYHLCMQYIFLCQSFCPVLLLTQIICVALTI